MLKQRNSKKQGDVGIGIAIGWFVANGYTVSIPLTDSQDYDLVVETDGVLKKVQVKTSTYQAYSGVYSVELRTKGGNRTGTGRTKSFAQCTSDLLFILTGDGCKYLIPTENCPKSIVSLGPKWDPFRVR